MDNNYTHTISPHDLQMRYLDAVILLKKLISTPSFSKEEKATADILEKFFQDKNIQPKRFLNNVWLCNKYFDSNKFTLLLNSHHDTVKPNSGYTFDPFIPIEKDEKILGLGSNDAGGALVSLISVFVHLYETDLPFNLVFAATAEEEISGKNGIEILLNELPKIDAAIVGEPTLMNMAVAEKGLLVLDAKAKGEAGHAARDEGVNSLYIAVQDIEWLRQFKFPKVSDLLGPVHMAITSINTPNVAHNVVPSECDFVIDIRVNELYSFEEIIETLRSKITSEITPRSTRLKSTSIDKSHPLTMAGTSCGFLSYGSPTSSDKALMPFPSLKIGPGDSARSHTANEFIYINEIKDGIEKYIFLLQNFANELGNPENNHK
ncbi:MAG: M20 family metallo-hydrolase [Ginsengibacter sp.]